MYNYANSSFHIFNRGIYLSGEMNLFLCSCIVIMAICALVGFVLYVVRDWFDYDKRHKITTASMVCLFASVLSIFAIIIGIGIYGVIQNW